MWRKNKSADQQYGYHAADLRLCFHICTKTAEFLMTWLYEIEKYTGAISEHKTYIILDFIDISVVTTEHNPLTKTCSYMICACSGWFEPCLFVHVNILSHYGAQL